MKKISFIFFLFAICACSKDDEGPFTDEVGIRIENLSSYTFDKVLVETGGGGEQEYFDVTSGNTTDYKSFDYTYRYAFVQTIIGTDTLTLQPIDYVGEQQFTSGRYTFQLDVVGETSPLYMVLEFKQD